MSELGYPIHLRNPAPGMYNPMDKYIFVREKKFTIVDFDSNWDYLECEDEDGRAVNIAKPYLLRVDSTLDGNTITMNGIDIAFAKQTATSVKATNASYDDETWHVTPSYIYDEEIWAMYKNTGINDSDKALIEWEETTHRIWALEAS